jgi:hypothetical protein
MLLLLPPLLLLLLLGSISNLTGLYRKRITLRFKGRRKSEGERETVVDEAINSRLVLKHEKKEGCDR